MIDLVLDTMLDQQQQLLFTIPANDPKAEFVLEDNEILHRGVKYFIREVQKKRDGSTILISATCDALWYRLGEDTHIGSITFTAATVSAGLASALDGTGWSVGAMTAATGSYTMEMEDVTPLQVVRNWAIITNTYVVWDTLNKTVDLVPERGADLGTGFRYGRNLTSIEKKSSVPYATVLYAYGADGLNIAGINSGKQYLEDFTFYTNQGLTLEEARERFTKRRVFSDTSFLADTELKAAAQTQLTTWAQGTVSYTCKVVDLQELLNTSEEFEVGDRVRVRDSELGFDVQTTVVRTKRFPLQPWRDEIELAYLPTLLPPSAAPSRPSSSYQWLLEGHNNSLDLPMRNDTTFLVNRIPLLFRNGGEAFFGYDIVFTGVGAGTLSVSAQNWETGELIHDILTLPYTDGEIVHGVMTWWEKELIGQYDWRIRMQAMTTGGPDAASGIDLDEGRSRFWVHYYGGVRQTPTTPNSVTYDYTGAVQEFIVPDGVTEITVTCKGAQGGGSKGGNGGEVTGTFAVTPGNTLDVIVGGQGTYAVASGIGWPNGGATPESAAGSVAGGAGGGSSDIRPNGTTIADAWIVAPGGGGNNRTGTSRPSTNAQGGAGRFFQGQDGWGLSPAQTEGVERGGRGASQYAGGAGGSPGGTAGTFGQGGAAAGTSNSFHFAGGGGGGGWYGGGGAGSPTIFGGGSYAGDGGGGSGHVSEDVTNVEISDGTRSGNGQVVISWETPDDV